VAAAFSEDKKRSAPCNAIAGENAADRGRNSANKEAALEGLQRWKAKHAEAAKLLTDDDILTDSMRGKSSNWTRIRLNLRHIPEALRPQQEAPDPDEASTKKET
jgi:bifunctional non-homologous end joining protein LigD